MAYILRIDQLRPGDIILERDYTEQSRNICRKMKSEYSHALLYRGNCSVVEADGIVVKITNPQRLLFDNINDVVVLRCPTISEQQALMICNYATNQFGKEYSTNRYEKLSTGEYKQVYQNRQYCTKLVAKSYEAAGIKIVKNSDLCNPQQILNSELLVRIPDIIKEPTDEELEIVVSDSILDRHGFEWGVVLENIRNLECVRKHVDCDIQDRDQLFAFVERHPEVDDEVSSLLSNSAYFSMWKEYHDSNPWEYDSNLLLEKYGEDAFPVAWCIYITNSSVLVSWKHDLYEFLVKKASTKLRVYSVFVDLYVNLVIDSELRDNASKNVMDQILFGME